MMVVFGEFRNSELGESLLVFLFEEFFFVTHPVYDLIEGRNGIVSLFCGVSLCVEERNTLDSLFTVGEGFEEVCIREYFELGFILFF